MDKVLEPHKLPQLNHEKIENVNRPITSKEIELVIKISQWKKAQDNENSLGEFYQTFKEELTTISLYYSKN